MKFKRLAGKLALLGILINLFLVSIAIDGNFSEKSKKETAQTQNDKKVVGFAFRWESDNGDYTFSIKNELENPIMDIEIRLIFYDYLDNVIDFQTMKPSVTIPQGFAKRFRGKVDSSTQKIVQKVETPKPPKWATDPIWKELRTMPPNDRKNQVIKLASQGYWHWKPEKKGRAEIKVFKYKIKK